MVATRVLLAVAFAAAGVLPLVLVRPALANREKPGSTGFLFVIAGISLWSFGAAGLQVAPTEGAALAAFSLRIAGPLVSASGFFMLLAEYTGLFVPTRRMLAGILGFAAAVQVVTWTNPAHHLVFGPDVSLAAETIQFERMGAVWVVNTIVSYAFNAAAFLLGVLEVQRSSGIRRRQTLTVIGAAIPPIGLNVLAQFWVSLSFDPTVLGFVVTAFVMGWALYGGTFLDVVPVARKRAIETMADPVVVIDERGRIVDSNPAARDLVDCAEDWKGMPATAFFEPFREHVERFRDEPDVEAEITTGQGVRRRHFDLNSSPIRGPQGDAQGRVVTIREITELKRREHDLDLMRQVQSRVLRHNIRNDLQVVRGTNELLASELDGEHAALASEAVEHCNDLLQTSSKARTVESLLDRDRTPEPVDLAAVARDTVEEYRSRFPAVEFAVDAPESRVVETTPGIEAVVENLVENAAAHNDAATPEVDVAVAEREAAVVVTVSDNGPGIPDEELAVLERGSETALSHGSGMGLWVVDWVLDRAAASVEFETGESGTCATVRVPRE
jgi:PAS domain S-box-containing protein